MTKHDHATTSAPESRRSELEDGLAESLAVFMGILIVGLFSAALAPAASPIQISQDRGTTPAYAKGPECAPR
jgi:hypothetical protein